MLKRLAIAVVVIVALFAAIVAMRPADFRIARSRMLAAPPEVGHAYVNDFHKWPEWSPWEKLDPNMKREISGPPSGPGASYGWSGNDKVGEGRMTITESRPPQNVTIRLEFLKPFTSTSTAQFELAPSGSGTQVTWAMRGKKNFLAKAFTVFMDMDKMVGSDFERGLANLDTATQAVKNGDPSSGGKS